MTPFSHSRLSAYENCPRRYEYRYVQKLPRESESIESFVGKRVHEILERLYHHVARHGRPPSLRQVLERFGKDWELHWHPQVEIVYHDLSTDDFRERGRRCLENYYRSYYPFDQDETLALERDVELTLDAEGTYRARGVIDRLVRTASGTYEIHDYKTGASLPPRARLDGDRQLALYQIGIQQTFADAEHVELVWHYLLFNRTLRGSRTPEQLEQVRAEAIEQICEIQAAISFPARPGPLCRWCEFKRACPEAAVEREPDSLLEEIPLAHEPARAPLRPLPPPSSVPVQLSLF